MNRAGLARRPTWRVEPFANLPRWVLAFTVDGLAPSTMSTTATLAWTGLLPTSRLATADVVVATGAGQRCLCSLA
jgi:hypothetical protein